MLCRMPAGRLFARATAAPAIALAAWLLVAFPLLYLGRFTPVLALALGIPAVLAAVTLLSRCIPDPAEPAPWWPLAAVGTITCAFAAVQLAYHAETIVIRRDPASYAQFTAWIARHGSLPVLQQRELIAGDDPALGYDSAAYYQVGEDIWPQFLSGAPLVYSPGHWFGGVEGMLLIPPLVGALGVLTFAGLAARLIGVRWAPAAALLLAVCLPQQWVSRSTYSEPVAQLLLLGGLLLAYDALARRGHLKDRWGSGHALAAAAGLVFGLALVVRVDALRDLLPVLGFAGLLLLARRAQAPPLLAGLLIGGGYGYAAGFLLSAPYLEYLSDSLRPLLWISAAVAAGTAALVAVLWRRGLPAWPAHTWLPAAAAVLAVLVLGGFAVRPLVHTEYGHGIDATGDYVAYVQRLEGLAIDPDRNYQEMSLHWVGWYVGPGAILLAAIALAVLWRRALQGRAPQWVLPLMVLSWSAAATLARPAITPDHPWASRRLVVLVLPAFILLAVWALAWLSERIRGLSGRSGAPLGGAVALAGAAVLLVPTAATASGVMTYRSDVGSVAEMQRLCGEIPENGSVIILDGEVSGGFAQLFRGMCGVPTAHALSAGEEDVRRILAEAEERGRTPVLAAADAARLAPYLPEGPWPRRAFHVDTEQDPSTLMRPPRGAWRFGATVYLATPTDP